MLCALFLSTMPVHAMERTPEGGEALETDPLIQWQSLLDGIKRKAISAEEFNEKMWNSIGDLCLRGDISDQKIQSCKTILPFYRQCIKAADHKHAYPTGCFVEWLKDTCREGSFYIREKITEFFVTDPMSNILIVGDGSTTFLQEESLAEKDLILLSQYKRALSYYKEALE